MKDEIGEGVTEYQLPRAEALLAGTLALMTCHAQSRCPAHRARAVLKIVNNFGALVQHPGLSPEFRAALGNLRRHWHGLAEGAGEQPASAPAAVPPLLH